MYENALKRIENIGLIGVKVYNLCKKGLLL